VSLHEVVRNFFQREVCSRVNVIRDARAAQKRLLSFDVRKTVLRRKKGRTVIQSPSQAARATALHVPDKESMRARSADP